MRITILGDLYYVGSPDGLYACHIGPGGPVFVDVDGRIRIYEPGLSYLKPGDVVLTKPVAVWTISQRQRLRKEEARGDRL